MNALDFPWSCATHDWPKVIVFQIFQLGMVELSENLKKFAALNYENLPERQTSNNPNPS